MKKLLLLFTTILLLKSVFSQTEDKKWGIGAGLGAYGTLNKSGVGFMPELYLSRYLSPRLDLMLKSDFGLFNSKLTNNLDIVNPFLNLRYKLADESKNLRSYLFAGPGFLSDNGESGLNFDLGVGAKYYISPATAFYLEAGYINGIETTVAAKNTRDNFWKAIVGIEFDFGKTKDSDMDGISDKKDKCPNTPAGVAVDDNGCPIDTDGDGVADYIDECPTVAGLTSLKGCPDTDKDGIADKYDACPEVAGLANLKGCPDTDGDGVADKDDKCQNTPKDWKVDVNGCPFDQDNDGVFDQEDDCPTIAGPKTNKGCPIKEDESKQELEGNQVEIQDIKVGPVHFASNKSDLTETAKGILDKLIQTLNSNTAYNLNISGHADSQGSDDQNQKLSQDRNESVINYLKSKGISPKRITQQKAFGESTPIATNETKEGRLQNRRVEFDIYKIK